MFDMFKNEHYDKQEKLMVLNERQEKILVFLKENKRASVKRLASHLYVSEMTIRRDLRAMESMGCLQRYAGGAVYTADYGQLPVEFRKLLHADEKKRLSEKTRKYLHDGMSVFIDSSSTCLYVIPLLSDYKDIKIVTNSVQCLIEASGHNIDCIMAGGTYYAHDMCTVGGETNAFLRRVNTDIGFFSAAAISDDGVVSDYDTEQTASRKAAMENCEKKIFMLDRTKMHKKFLYTIARKEEIDDIIIV